MGYDVPQTLQSWQSFEGGIHQEIEYTFQWTKTLYQNNLKNITFSFTIFKG